MAALLALAFWGYYELMSWWCRAQLPARCEF